MATAVATRPAAVEPPVCPLDSMTYRQVRAHARAWSRRFVAEHPERHMILRDTPRRCEILYRLPHLRAWRVAAGWTQWELAYRSGVDAGTISRLERGRTVARIITVERLASALGIENTVLIEAAPAADVAVMPTQRIQAIEGAPGDVRFYLHHLWYDVEHYAGGLEALAAAVDLSVGELRAVAEVERPAPWAVVERLARELNTPALALMEW